MLKSYYFSSAMSGAPSLQGATNGLIGLLDGCTKDGFGSVTVNTLTVASNIATANVSGGHQFAMLGAVGPVIRIEGASPSGLNGDWRVTVTDSTHFTFATTGISDQTASGTMTAKRAPLGFSKEFSGTNKAVYRADSVLGTRLRLRVADDGTGSAAYARVRGFKEMSDVDTGTEPYPTDAQLSGGLYWHKSSTANSTVRDWRLFGDAQGFYMFVKTDGTNWNGFSFCDLIPEKAGDAFHSLIIGSSDATATKGNFAATSDTPSGHFMPRAISQTGTALIAAKYGAARMNITHGLGFQGFPYPPATGHNDNFYCSQVLVADSVSSVYVPRGILAGVYNPLHASASLTDGALLDNIAGLPGKTLMIQKLHSAGVNFAVAIDLTDWR